MKTTRIIGVALSLAFMAGATHATDPNLARNLAATCANCHGTDGRTVDGDGLGEMISLAGMPADEILEKVNDYRSGDMPATIMHQIAKGYTDEQLRLIADYFAAQAK